MAGDYRAVGGCCVSPPGPNPIRITGKKQKGQRLEREEEELPKKDGHRLTSLGRPPK